MKSKGKKTLFSGIIFISLFTLWTWLIQIADVEPIGVNGSNIGFSTLNAWFHSLTGLNMALYNITDWLGIVPLFVCLLFGTVGFFQLLKRKSLFKVDFDIIILGVYYFIVILCYLAFEKFPINYRPVLINGCMEASYPSSTVLLVMSVMPTLIFQVNRRLKSDAVKKIICILTVLFSAFTVIGRLVSGVHWFSDIIGGALLSAGVVLLYRAIINWEVR